MLTGKGPNIPFMTISIHHSHGLVNMAKRFERIEYDFMIAACSYSQKWKTNKNLIIFFNVWPMSGIAIIGVQREHIDSITFRAKIDFLLLKFDSFATNWETLFECVNARLPCNLET